MGRTQVQTPTRVIRNVPLLMDENGTGHPSLVHSMFAWRNFLGYSGFRSYKPELDESGNCKYCHKRGGYIEVTPYGVIRCICGVKDEEAKLAGIYTMYQSSIDDVDISQLEIWGDKQSMDSIQIMIDAVRNFETWPDRWLVLSGYNGTGKSHALQYIAYRLRPWALYITDYEFEQYAYSALNEKRYEKFLKDISNVPVLVYDDYGSSHGSDFGKSTLRKVIMYRSNTQQSSYELPTAIATNLKRTDGSLKLYDPRIADRFQDEARSNYIGLVGVKSWRSDR